jgi:hypothetical protein
MGHRPAGADGGRVHRPGQEDLADESGALDGGDILPGFRVPLAKLFERLEKPRPKKRKK